MTVNMAGLELLFATAQSHIRNRGDAVVCAIHWSMIANGFKCIGTGDEVPATTDGADRSEMLPAGWSADSDTYGLLYLPNSSNDTHLLKIIRTDNSLLVHVLRSSDNKLADVTLDTREYTTENLSSFRSTFKNLKELKRKFEREIVKQLKPPAASARRTPGHSDSSEHRAVDRGREDPEYDPLRVGPSRGRGRPTPGWVNPSSPLSVGRGDLDPLGRGGGMLMDPRGFQGGRLGGNPDVGLPGGARLPPGSVPPGARFDPFGPINPDANARAGPDPDHLPQPDFYEDLFM